MLYTVILFVFVVICLLLIGIILLQTSQSGGMGSIGGGNSYLEGALGSQGADSLLLKTTTVFAIVFMSLAIIINIVDNPDSNFNRTTGKSSLQGNAPSGNIDSDIQEDNNIIPEDRETNSSDSIEPSAVGE